MEIKKTMKVEKGTSLKTNVRPKKKSNQSISLHDQFAAFHTYMLTYNIQYM